MFPTCRYLRGISALSTLLLAFGCLYGQTPEVLLAEERFAEAAHAFANRGERSDHLAAGEAWLKIDSFSLAREQLRQAITSGPDSLSGLAHHKIGLSHYYEFDDAGAVAAYRQAIRIRDEILPANHLDRAHSRSNMAGSLLYLGQTDSAGLLLREAIDIYASAPQSDTLNWLRSLIDLMQVSIELRDYQVGTSAASSALNLLKQAPGLRLRDQQSAFYTAGATYRSFEEVGNAKINAEKALDLAKQMESPEDQVQALNLLSAIADTDGKPKQYITYGEQAVAISRNNELVNGELGLLYFNLARAYWQQGNSDKAESNADLAAPLLAEFAPYQLPGLANVRGSILREQQDLEAALAAFNNGLYQISGLPIEENTLHYPAPDSLEGYQLEVTAAILGDRAEVLAQLGKSTEALADYNLLFTVQDLLRARVSSDESRRYLSQNLRPFFDRAIDLYVSRFNETADQEDLWRAFELSERAKAYSLLTSLQQGRTKMPKREAELRGRIAQLERTATSDPSQQAYLDAARLQLDRLLQLSREELAAPDFSVDRQALLGWLQQGDMDLLAFHLNKETGHLFLLDKSSGRLSWSNINKANELANSVKAFRDAVVNSAYRLKSLRPAAEQHQLDEAYLQNGLALKAQLFQGGNATIPTGNIVLITDGALNFLPFGCLPLQDEEIPLNYQQVNYLQSDRQLNYAYSVAFLLAVADAPSVPHDFNLLAFAPEFKGTAGPASLSRATKRPLTRIGERALPGLSPLRHNAAEVAAITDLVPSARAYLAKAADRKNFLDAMENGGILHLSTHGMVNAAEPQFSFVAFSQLGDSLELEELLYFNDLSSLRLQTELVVLSACETNLGAYVPGETALSLASAFAAAGARSTLTSLWQVDDAATKELMVRFYEGLTAGKSRGEALLLAQQSHLNSSDYGHPYYWSAFTLYGEPGTLTFTTASWGSALIYPVLGIVVLLLIFLFLRRK
ncbi:MAG: CHAT domain-containing protein [Bacteroidota bacterium]